ncbi:unnamed protein product, partial [Hapterophycus canaliculatus]
QSAQASGGWITCTVCHQQKPTSDFSRNQLARSSREVCAQCLMSQGAVAAPPSRVAPAAGEGFVRCVACCQLKTTSAFGINQLRRRAGIERCMSCVESDHGSMVLCNACHTQKPFTEFSKKQLACKPGSERCKACIETASG